MKKINQIISIATGSDLSAREHAYRAPILAGGFASRRGTGLPVGATGADAAFAPMGDSPAYRPPLA